jgi:anti-anti-sigma regulatory factor
MFEVKQVSSDEVILAVDGPLMGESAVAFGLQMEDLVATRKSVITLDLSRTPAINSAAIGKILTFKKKLVEQQRTLQIRGCSKELFGTFQMIKFDTLMSIKP